MLFIIIRGKHCSYRTLVRSTDLMFVSQHDESAVEPVLVVLWPALWRALLPHDVIGLDHGGHEVVRPDLPPGGEGRRPRELGARVAVVADGVPLGPRPDISVSGCNHVIGRTLFHHLALNIFLTY